MDLLPKSEAAKRLQRMQAWMQNAGVDAVFVMQNADLYYFSGTVQVGLLCLPAAGEPVYLIQKSVSRGRMESPWEQLIAARSLGKSPELLADHGITGLARVGLEMDVLPANFYLRFRELYPAVEFVDASDAIRKLRMIKSPYEVSLMRRAAATLEHAFRVIPDWMRPGVTELEVLAQLEGFLRKHGHQGLIRLRGFNLELAYGVLSSGPNACHPTFFPGPVGSVGLYPAIPNSGSERRLLPGDAIMLDIAGGCGGYIVDKTRTFALGDLAPDMLRAHQLVLALMKEIEAMLKPGVPCERIYQHALARVTDSPYAENFMGSGDSKVRFVGHGVGLELDEWPVLADRSSTPLEAGMTIAVEPKIFIPDCGGVGIENTYWITAGGCENLTVFPEDIIRVPCP